MHLSSALLFATAALLPATLAAITPPTNFLLEAKAIPGLTTSNKYNRNYLSVEATESPHAVPLFTRINGYASFFTFTNPAVHGNATYYTLNWINDYGPRYAAQMQFDAAPYAAIQPVAFQKIPKNNFTPSQVEAGFYIGGTEHDMQLMWTDKFAQPADGDFSGWLICYFQYLEPQLFFLAGQEDPTKLKLPDVCSVFSLQIIPAQS